VAPALIICSPTRPLRNRINRKRRRRRRRHIHHLGQATFCRPSSVRKAPLAAFNPCRSWQGPIGDLRTRRHAAGAHRSGERLTCRLPASCTDFKPKPFDTRAHDFTCPRRTMEADERYWAHFSAARSCNNNNRDAKLGSRAGWQEARLAPLPKFASRAARSLVARAAA